MILKQCFYSILFMLYNSNCFVQMSKEYPLSEVAKHNKDGDMWIVIHGKVYDVSNFDKHPGTKAPLLANAGKDATEKFDAINHSESAKELMKKFEIGVVGQESCGKCPVNPLNWHPIIQGLLAIGAAAGVYYLYTKKSDSAAAPHS